jgi:predicted dithiol-disulfide oxidoreductase (DUF899 family)
VHTRISRPLSGWQEEIARLREERLQLLKREAEPGTNQAGPLAEQSRQKLRSRKDIGMSNVHFPNESREYRAARDALTAAETELTSRIEEVAALRRRLPPGGTVSEDYVFTEGPADPAADAPTRQVRLSDLFDGHDTLLLYSFMYGPEMSRPCQMCTSLLDGLDGAAPDVAERAGFAVVAKSPIDRLRQYGRERGWMNMRLVSSAGSTYNRDYHGEDDQGDQVSRMNVFTRHGGVIRHFWATEQTSALPGQEDRHVDTIWPLWNLLDMTPVGRGDWHPAYSPKTPVSPVMQRGQTSLGS